MAEVARVTGPLGRAVEEVLHSILSPRLSREVLTDACRRAGRSSFPEDPTAAAEIIEGPLHDLVDELFGKDAAHLLVLDLAPVIQMASSGVRRRSALTPAKLPEVDGLDLPSSYTSRTRPAPAAVEIVVATLAPSLPPELTRRLEGLAHLRRIRDAFELISAVEGRDAPLWIVLDGYRPCVDALTLAAFLRGLPEDCRVWLWGCDDGAARRLVAERPQWRAIDASASWSELGVALRVYVSGT